MEDSALLLAAAATVTATTNETGIDLTQGVGGWNPDGAPSDPNGPGAPVAAKIPVTALVGTGTYTAKLQDSPDNSTWTDISAAKTIAATGTAWVGGFSRQQYCRLVLTLGGTSPSITFNGVYLEPLVAHMA